MRPILLHGHESIAAFTHSHCIRQWHCVSQSNAKRASAQSGRDFNLTWSVSMEWLTPETLSALAAIIVIDIVLAGDNAIVIALAARSLPSHLQKKAILWGTVGAIVVRVTMTGAVVWLLGIPGLMLAGGLVLTWIAIKLLAPADEGEGHNISSASNFWTALKTIVIADAAMGLDNVLAVAGASQGSLGLVIAGLLISIPLVVWGSTIVLKCMDRFPWIVYVGAAVLGWTAAHMITGEPWMKEHLEGHFSVVVAIHVALIGLILASGLMQRRRARPANNAA
jgi:YjbE family integral membrane protein